MELSWRFRICHYLNKHQTDYEYLVDTLRYNSDLVILRSEREDLRRVFRKYDQAKMLFPEYLINLLCQQFTCDRAKLMIDTCFMQNGTLRTVTDHADYTVQCPQKLLVDTNSAWSNHLWCTAQRRVHHVLMGLTEKELDRVKLFLSNEVVVGVRHIPCSAIEFLTAHLLATQIVNRLHGHYKCVMFAILTVLGRDELIMHIGVPTDTKLAA